MRVLAALATGAAVVLTASLAWAADLPADLRAAQRAYDQAQVRNDRAELERLLADDFQLHNGAGRVQDKQSFIKDSTASGFRIEPFVVEEPLERLLGETALLGGVATLKGVDAGKPFSARLRFVDVWAKRDGAWRVVFVQTTAVAN